MQKNTQKDKWVCRYAPSLGALEGVPDNVWATTPVGIPVSDEQCVWFGLYGLPDFFSLWRHKGRKAILWAGTDIIHFKNGYWLDEEGAIRISPAPLARWIRENCESYCENEVEKQELESLGIPAKVVPSFMGDIEDFPLSYKPSKQIRLYTSVSGDNFKQYGWDKIPELARKYPDIEFHLYGNKTRVPPMIPFNQPNIFVHGRVSKEEMNSQIKDMTGAIRLTEFDGFSEIIAKSLLWGQWPVSIIKYPHTLAPENLDMLRLANKPNQEGREWLLSVVNKYPWNHKK